MTDTTLHPTVGAVRGFFGDVASAFAEPIGTRTVQSQRLSFAPAAAYLTLDALLCWVVIGWANGLPFEAMLWAHNGLYLLRGAVAVVFLGRRRLTLLFSDLKRETRWSLMVVTSGAAAVAVAAAVTLLSLRFFGVQMTVPSDGPMSVGIALGCVAMTVILAPATEEMIDRAVFLDSLPGHFPGWLAIAASAALFGFMHAVPYRQGGIPIFPFIGGALTATAFLMRRSLVAPMLIHAGGNAFLVVLEMVAGNVTVWG